MSNPEPALTPRQVKILLHELHDFKQTSLYEHFKEHFQTLYDETVEQIIEERLKGPETLYTREGWIGEARAAKLQTTWFEDLFTVLEEQAQQLEE